MAAQAAMKAPFRLGTKEVHLYVFRSRYRAILPIKQPTEKY
jgi:hypothetical protein